MSSKTKSLGASFTDPALKAATLALRRVLRHLRGTWKASGGGSLAISCDSGLIEYASAQAVALRSLGWPVVLVCVDRKSDVGDVLDGRNGCLDDARTAGVIVELLPKRRGVKLIEDVKALRQVLRVNSVTCLINHESYDPRVAGVALLIPTAIYLHDPRPHSDDPLSSPPLIARAVMRFSELTASLIVIHSKRLAGQIRPFLKHQPVAYVPHGAEVTGSPLPKPVEPNVLMYGRIAGYKGIDVALDAFARARNVVPDLTFTIAGRGPLAGRVEADAVYGVTLMNRYINRHEVRELMARASLVLLPYKDATQSGAGTQAVGLGVPAIVSEIGALPDLVLPACPELVVKPEDAEDLARAITTLVGHTGELRHRVQENARTQFGWPVAAQLLADELCVRGLLACTEG